MATINFTQLFGYSTPNAEDVVAIHDEVTRQYKIFVAAQMEGDISGKKGLTECEAKGRSNPSWSLRHLLII